MSPLVWSDDHLKLWKPTRKTPIGVMVSLEDRGSLIDTANPLKYTTSHGSLLLSDTGFHNIYPNNVGNGLPQVFEEELQDTPFNTNRLTLEPYPKAGAIAYPILHYGGQEMVYFSGIPWDNGSLKRLSQQTPSNTNPVDTYKPRELQADNFAGYGLGNGIVSKENVGIFRLAGLNGFKRKSQLIGSPIQKQNLMKSKATEINKDVLIGFTEDISKGSSLSLFRPVNGQWLPANQSGLGVSRNNTIRKTSAEMIVYQNQHLVYPNLLEKKQCLNNLVTFYYTLKVEI